MKKKDKIEKSEIVEAVNSKFEGKTIEFAPEDKCEEYYKEMKDILKIIKYSDAWVSDESMFSDFPLDREDLEKASSKLGIDLNPNEFLVTAAARLRMVRQSRH
jgi:hypothetical protein